MSVWSSALAIAALCAAGAVVCLTVTGFIAVRKFYEGDTVCGRLIAPGPEQCNSALQDQHLLAGAWFLLAAVLVTVALLLNARVLRQRRRAAER